MATKTLYFDSAATTPCCPDAGKKILEFACERFGNPSSTHSLGQKSARALKEARQFFAQTFGVEASQVVFTGSGTESDNMAIYGVAMQAIARNKPAKIITTSVEHPAVKQCVESLKDFGLSIDFIPVAEDGSMDEADLLERLTPDTALVSIMRVNNIMGRIYPVEALASKIKAKVPTCVVHSDCVQAFTKVDVPKAGSPVDMVSISAHKIEGPKGIGALIILNKELLTSKTLRPLIWGGSQEGGLRSGTQNTGLIAAFHCAAESAITKHGERQAHIDGLHAELRRLLEEKKFFGGEMVWNSPEGAVNYIVSLGLPNLPAGPLANLLEDRGCLVATGSACSSNKASSGDPVLTAMGVPASAIRVSLSHHLEPEDIRTFVTALDECMNRMISLQGGQRG